VSVEENISASEYVFNQHLTDKSDSFDEAAYLLSMYLKGLLNTIYRFF